MMSKKFVAPVIGASFLMMGLSMPSCPGQQAMQQQVDALKASETEMKNRIAGLEGQIKSLRDEAEQTKGLMAQLGTGLTEQGKAIEEMKAAAAQPKPAAKPAAKPAKGKKK
jgi:septal ring factor EnvC (AmiA/AmiB activator)